MKKYEYKFARFQVPLGLDWSKKIRQLEIEP